MFTLFLKHDFNGNIIYIGFNIENRSIKRLMKVLQFPSKGSNNNTH